MPETVTPVPLLRWIAATDCLLTLAVPNWPLERAAPISLLQICCRWFEKSKKPKRAA